MAYQPELEKLERRYADEPAKNFAQLAEAYRRGGRLDEALDLLLMHLQERPTYVSALIVLGRCHLDKQQLGDAAQAFERVLAVDGENIIALKVLAEVAQQQGDSGGARSWLTRLLEVDPMNEEAEAQLAALAAGPASDETPAADSDAAPAAADAPPAEEVVIERASTELAAPVPDEAVRTPPDLELETPPPPDVAVPEQSREGSDVQRFDGPLWERYAGDEAESVPAEAGDAPPSDAAPTAEASEAPAEELETVELQPFDSELAWGTGERMSGEISQDDLEHAEHAHEASLDVPAQELPGLEDSEVPAPESAHDVTPTEGLLSEELAQAARDAEPLPGLELTEVTADHDTESEPEQVGDLVTEEGGELVAPDAFSLEPEPDAELEPRPRLEADSEPAAAEAGAADEPEDEPAFAVGAGQERGSLAGLPVFMPEVDADGGDEAADDDAAAAPDAAEGAEPEPVVTETMAELYARQGLTTEAKDVYRRLLAARPGDARLRQRLVELERRRTGAAAAADPRTRYEADRTGGVSARDFLRAVLEGRAAVVATVTAPAETPTPLDDAFGDEPLEPRGAPTRPASDQPSLASVFGEEEAAPSSPTQASARGGEAEGGFSFDEFFGERRAEADETDGGAEGSDRAGRPSAEDIDDSDESFKAWLKGLKS